MAATPGKGGVGNFLLGNGCILLATIFWGINVPATKVLIPEWMTADGVSAVRLVGGCILFWLASIFFKCEPIQKGDWLKIILGGAVGLFLFIFLFVTSLKYGNAIDISIIMTLPPMFVVLMEVIFMHQRPSLAEYLGLVISFAGAVIVIVTGASHTQSGSNILLGNAIAVLSTICYAFYLVILEKPTHTYRPLSLLRWVFLFAAIPGLCLVPGMQDMPIVHAETARPWIWIGFILFCPTFIAYFLVQPAIKKIGSELVSLYQYLLPVCAAIACVAIGIEELHWTQCAAMVVIVIGMAVTNLGKRKRVKKTHEAAKTA
ncbi:MAG: DMT family transporter [Desulfovibrio sp.]|nr:DMT family transporter [Desulfovibrio sp.]